MIHDIPKMDEAKRNEARRFMWLVDAFYDRQRFLVCSAEASLPKIYHGIAWKAEFPQLLGSYIDAITNTPEDELRTIILLLDTIVTLERHRIALAKQRDELLETIVVP